MNMIGAEIKCYVMYVTTSNLTRQLSLTDDDICNTVVDISFLFVGGVFGMYVVASIL